MLGLYQELFKSINQDVPYVVWKACHELCSALNGHGDIDLLVELEFRDQFQSHLRNHGFVRAWYTSLNFPFVEHYYGYDRETGGIGHLHVYYKIVTGESHVKSYQLPFEKEVIANRFLDPEGVYEAAYSDQALIYSMRHYMKRADLIGFLLWAYEEKDYLDEYEYISNGLRATGRINPLPGENELHYIFDFHDIDLGIGVSGYLRAKDKITSIACFRRFTTPEAFWKGLYYLGVRLYHKIFGVKKRLDNGLVLAVSGVDGSGKTSMVRELHDWLGKNFEVYMLHLGKPSPTILTFYLRPLLFVYRVIKGKDRDVLHDSDNCSGGITLKRKNGLVWAVRYLALALERYNLARLAEKHARKGGIIICDRYPTMSPGKMDSPQIGSGGSWLVERMRLLEVRLYERLPKADGLLFLDVSIQEAINRNRKRIKKDKETDDGIEFRHKNNQGLNFRAGKVFFVDADCEYGSVLKSLKSITWTCITKVHKR